MSYIRYCRHLPPIRCQVLATGCSAGYFFRLNAKLTASISEQTEVAEQHFSLAIPAWIRLSPPHVGHRRRDNKKMQGTSFGKRATIAISDKDNADCPCPNNRKKPRRPQKIIVNIYIT